VMAVLVEWLRHAVAGLVPALQLAVLVPAGALLYVGMARLAGLKEWREMTTLVGARLRGKFSGSPQ